MENERLLHDLIVDRLKGKFAGQYNEIKVNSGGNPDCFPSAHKTRTAAHGPPRGATSRRRRTS